MPIIDESANGNDRSDNYNKNPNGINCSPNTAHKLTVDFHHALHDTLFMKT